MTTYETLSLLLQLSGGWIAAISVLLSVTLFLVKKEVIVFPRQSVDNYSFSLG